MAAPNRPVTAPARAAKKSKACERAEANGTLQELQLRVWRAINRIDGIISDNASDPALVLKASHALFQGAAAFAKVLGAGEFEARLEALENPTSRHLPHDDYFANL